MATNTSGQSEADSPSSHTQDANIVLCINFSNEHTTYFHDFRQSLLEQAPPSNVIRNEEEIIVKFDNKYYTADIEFRLYSAEDENEILKVASIAQALVIIIDHEESSRDRMREMWSDAISNKCSSDVKLICEYEDPTNSLEENLILLWSIKEHFEHIPMGEQQVDSGGEDNDFIKEKTGAARMLEALQAHAWDNLQMKDKPPKSPVKKECIFDNPDLNGHECKSIKSEDKIDSLLDTLDVAGVLNDDDPDCESFEELFSNLMEMKKKAEGLEGDDRKNFAEKVATMFLNAIPDSDDD